MARQLGWSKLGSQIPNLLIAFRFLQETRTVIARCLISVCFILAAAGQAWAVEDGFVSLFDGKTLEGWDGNPDFWRVDEGTITGQTTAEKPTKGNTFIIYRKGDVGDFELKLEYKIVGGNSGVQYRSFEVANEKWVVGGYQADIDSGDTFSGINYGERFRGILANRGQKTVIGDDHKPKVIAQIGDSKELQSKIKKEDWNEYHIIAKGYTFIHKINGNVTSECTDEDMKERKATGILALQLHAGPPMKVQFRNIRIKKLEAAKPDAKNGADAKPSTATKAIAQVQVGGADVGAQIDAVAQVAAVAQSLTEARAVAQPTAQAPLKKKKYSS